MNFDLILKSRHFQILNFICLFSFSFSVGCSKSVFFWASISYTILFNFSKCEPEAARGVPKLGKKNPFFSLVYLLGKTDPNRTISGGQTRLRHKSFLGLSVGLCGPLDPALKPHCLSRFPLPRTITCGVMLDRDPYAPCGLYFSRANVVSMRLVS